MEPFMRKNHVCAVFSDRSLFAASAVDFLAAGLDLGLQVGYITDRKDEQMMSELAGLGDVDRLQATGELFVASLHDTYEDGHVVEPVSQVAHYRSATHDALAAGYQGLRVAADATPLVRTPKQLQQFLRYEHLVDHIMVDEPFSAMCGYDGAVLDASTTTQLACLHPHSSGCDPDFHLYAAGDGTARLDGETDSTTCEMLAALCDTVWPEDDLVIDLAGTHFIDHQSIRALDATAIRHNRRLQLRHPSPTITKIFPWLNLSATDLAVS